MLFSNSAHQISRMKFVPWHSKNKTAFLKCGLGQESDFLIFLRQLFSAYLNAVCILHQSCLLYWDFTPRYSCHLCWLCSDGRERLPWVWFVHHRQDCNFTLMPEIFGNDTRARKEHNQTFISQAEPAVLPAEENMDLAFFFFPPRKSRQHLELEKKLIW